MTRCWDPDRGCAFTLGSLLVHAAALGCLLAFVKPMAPSSARAPERLIEWDIVARPQQVVSPGERSRLTASVPSAASRDFNHRALRQARSNMVRRTAHVASHERAASEPREPEQGPSTTNETSQAAVRTSDAGEPVISAIASKPAFPIDLSARRVASEWSEKADATMRSCAVAPAGSDRDGCTVASANAAAVALARSFLQNAGAPVYLAARRSPPLQRESDGTYSYRGRSYRARIDHDGTVAFVDRVAGRKHPRRDRQLDSAEKRWFLAETEAMRAQLANSARVREQMQARRALELELEHIVGAEDDAALVHRRILTLWQDCGTDAETPRARHIVERFVRMRLPQTSRLGFRDSELDAFNRARPAAQAFKPYL